MDFLKNYDNAIDIRIRIDYEALRFVIQQSSNCAMIFGTPRGTRRNRVLEMIVVCSDTGGRRNRRK